MRLDQLATHTSLVGYSITLCFLQFLVDLACKGRASRSILRQAPKDVCYDATPVVCIPKFLQLLEILVKLLDSLVQLRTGQSRDRNTGIA